LGSEAYDPVDHLLLRELSMLYGAERMLGLGEGDARPRLCVLTSSDLFCVVIRGEATGDSCVEDIRELRFDGGG